MVVIYAEKASLAKSIANALHAGRRHNSSNLPTVGWWEFKFNDEDAVICHGTGHLCEPVPAMTYGEQYKYWDINKYPCIPSQFLTHPKENTKGCYEIVADWFKRADWLINATDPDREGELIFGLIYSSLDCKLPWKRVLLEDLTENTIVNAFNNLKTSEEMLPLQLAGRARQEADWLIGINSIVAMTKMFGDKDNILSVGRVQTPTLNLVVQRELAIKNHTKKPFWKLTGDFDINGSPLSAEYKDGNFDDKQQATDMLNRCIQAQYGTVTKKETKLKKISVPLLYNATQLRIAANKAFGWSLKDTDKIMQTLYENHLMTYPRTSSEYLPEAMKDDVTATLQKIFKLPEYEKYAIDDWEPYTSRTFDDSKVGSHTAIIPTTAVPNSLASLSEKEKQLYDLLVKSIIRVIYSKSEIEETSVEIAADENIMFSAKGNVIKKRGWYCIDAMPKSQKIIPNCAEGDRLAGKYKLTEGETKPPKRYTQATLIADMELAGKKLDDENARALMLKNKMGLGTEATRTAIVQQLFSRGYIIEKGKSLYATDKGMYLINTLPIDELKSVEMTGQWEKKLNDISTNNYNYDDYIKIMREKTDTWFKGITTSKAVSYHSADEVKCPFCGKPMKMQKFGLACTGYKEGCKFVIGKEICGKKITAAQMKLLVNSGKTHLIKGFKSKTSKEFDAVLTLDKTNNKIGFEFPKPKKK